MHMSENTVIFNKFFNLIVHIVGSDHFCFILLCNEVAMYQCIIFHRALCHHA